MGKILSQTSEGAIEAPTCPKCGSENVIGVTRVVGYYSRIGNWNRSKLGELLDRQRGKYDFEGESSNLDAVYDSNGVEIRIYGKDGCSICGSAERRIRSMLTKNGLESIAVFKHDIADKEGNLSPENLAMLVGSNGSPTQIPHIAVISDGRLVYSAGTIYRKDKPAQLPATEDILEAVRYGLEKQEVYK